LLRKSYLIGVCGFCCKVHLWEFIHTASIR